MSSFIDSGETDGETTFLSVPSGFYESTSIKLLASGVLQVVDGASILVEVQSLRSGSAKSQSNAGVYILYIYIMIIYHI